MINVINIMYVFNAINNVVNYIYVKNKINVINIYQNKINIYFAMIVN